MLNGEELLSELVEGELGGWLELAAAVCAVEAVFRTDADHSRPNCELGGCNSAHSLEEARHQKVASQRYEQQSNKTFGRIENKHNTRIHKVRKKEQAEWQYNKRKILSKTCKTKQKALRTRSSKGSLEEVPEEFQLKAQLQVCRLEDSFS